MARRLPVSGIVLLFLIFISTVLFPAVAHAEVCSAPANAVVAENCQAGNPASEWDISGAGDSTIQGFAADISVNRGQTISFSVVVLVTRRLGSGPAGGREAPLGEIIQGVVTEDFRVSQWRKYLYFFGIEARAIRSNLRSWFLR